MRAQEAVIFCQIKIGQRFIEVLSPCNEIAVRIGAITTKTGKKYNARRAGGKLIYMANWEPVLVESGAKDDPDIEKLGRWNRSVEGWQNRRQDKAAYRLALAFLAWVDNTLTKNRQGDWMWMTTDNRRLTTVEHVAAALLSGDLAPLPGVSELPIRYLGLDSRG